MRNVVVELPHHIEDRIGRFGEVRKNERISVAILRNLQKKRPST